MLKEILYPRKVSKPKINWNDIMRSLKIIMKVKSKLKLNNMILLTLDSDILEKNADFILIDEKKYQYDIAYDMPSTIGVKITEIKSDEVEFI